MMVEQAGDCIGFLGFLLYVGPCLLGKKSVYLKKMFIVIKHFCQGKLLKRGANSVVPDHEAASNHLSGLPLIAFTNLHHHHQSENAQINCTITTMTLLLLHRSRANQDSRGGKQFGPRFDFPGMRGTGGRDPPGMGLMILSFRTHKL